MDDLTIISGQQQISGWTTVRVTRGIERMPNDFQIEMTERNPDGSQITISPGAQCQIKLGEDLVLTGYIDTYEASVDSDMHTVSISGRSKSEDVVDCSAEYPNAQIMSSTALQIAQKLSEPYGITVAQNVGPTIIVPQFNLMYGETAVEIIERVTRFYKLLYYDMPDGSILLTQASTKQAGSGLTQGVNVQSAKVRFDMTRFSDYVCVYQSVATFSDGQSLDSGQNNSMNQFFEVQDPTVPRHRQKIIIVQSGDINPAFQVTRDTALWESNRRYGKAYELHAVVDSWRDATGKLWEPNTLVPINIPALKLVNVTWLINEVTYVRDENGGTTASLILNPPQAFTPEPIIIVPQPFAEGIADATGAATVNTPGPINILPLPAGSGQ